MSPLRVSTPSDLTEANGAHVPSSHLPESTTRPPGLGGSDLHEFSSEVQVRGPVTSLKAKPHPSPWWSPADSPGLNTNTRV